MTIHGQISSYSEPAAQKTVFIGNYNKPLGRSLQFFYFDAGGGHRSAATALRDVIAGHYPHWQIDLVNLFSDVLRPLDPVHRMRKVYRVEDLYNGILKRGWTYGFTALLRMQQKLIKMYAPAIEELMHQYWQEQNPDLIVSFVPHFNDVMIRTLKQVHPRTPYVTVMTDLADCPPNFWLGRPDHFVICGSDRAAHQARAAGYQPQKVFKTSGMILKPDFYRNGDAFDRREERRKLGLDPDLPTALIMFGGNGAQDAVPIVRRLTRGRPRVQCIVMCGRNEKLRRQLAKRKFCHAVSFTADKVSYYMSLADFFIGKPGPGSISEALHMGLPVIVEYNRRTMPQERYNAFWIQEQELGITVKSFTFIAAAVRGLLKDGRLETFRRNARRFNNRAVYEIPGMLASIMREGFD